ncbi:GntR family transcriptional repressor for pyruvate dehydrogenase complex [Aeromicrobium panaciterrae]|uniref:GntR family transcriptional repressor for pyruvate dehydrogenase complex n=1 Tax=Aeromicrobium panaciterrae TaxID=363861 RepID=A0ABU1UL30_9ACTN|nr:GntR family transcriptional regulator [Aeromicrobium panaciterrae]MDR7085884.1 GntR family transcriptional repressor for pyruvate dehydrogenase complex [Aeromicrobium panaciterrae]
MTEQLLEHDALADAVLRPVRGHHAFESCVEKLATSIRLGIYADGSTLPPERELAERIGVSRATLREAIAALREAGLVTTRRGRGGGTVVDFRPGEPGSRMLARPREELLDALDFRRIVEPGAAQAAAATTLTDQQEAMLRAALDKVNTASSKALHRQADSQFHLAIASLSDSALLIDAVTNVQICLHDMLDAIPLLDRNIDHSRQQHDAIAKAILAGSGARARRIMESHCDDTAALLRGLM